MEIKNKIQHKMLVNRLIERSYQVINNIKTISNRSQESGLRATRYQLIMLILLSIIICSCYSIESDCGDNGEIPIDPGPLLENGFWEYTGGPRYVESISVANNGDIWVGGIGFGIFLSTDNGDTWVEKNNGLQTGAIGSIAVSPINGYIFAGTAVKGVFRSTDGGENWVKVTNDMEVRDILITTSGEIYFGSAQFGGTGKLYYSNDNCDTWIDKGNGLWTNYNVFIMGLFAMGTDGTLYVGAHRGVYRSTNGGDTWLPPSNHTSVQINELTISGDGSIFAAASETGVIKSTNSGDTWNQVNTGIGGGYANRIIYNPITKDIFVSFGSRIFRSTNLGTSWELENIGFPKYPNGVSAEEFAFNPNTGQMYVATMGGVYRSKNYPYQFSS